MTNRSRRPASATFGHLACATVLLLGGLVGAARADSADATEAQPAPKTAAAAAAANAAAAEAPPAKPAAESPAPPARAPSSAPLVHEDDTNVTPPPGPPPPNATRPYSRRVRRLVEPPQAPRGEARQGLLFSLGFGGASLFTSTPGYGRSASTDLDVRIGYGFSDRFQMFIDIDSASARYAYGAQTELGTVTLRGQTVLVGDRQGNGLTLNAGIGLGSFNTDLNGGYSYCCGPAGRGGRWGNDRQLGFVAAGGLSYDARLGRYFSLSPELFASWMTVPNDDRKQDIATQVGLRLKLLWYLK